MKAEIENGKILGIEEAGVEIEFGNPPSIGDLEDVEWFLNFCMRHYPSLRGEEPTWSQDEFGEFMEDRSDSAKAFLKVLASRDGEWVSIGDVLKEMEKSLGEEYDSAKLRGVLMALNKSVHNTGRPELFERDYDDNDQLFYRLGVKFGEIIREYLDSD